MSDNPEDDFASEMVSEADGAAMLRFIGLVAQERANSSVSLEVMECVDLATELTLAEVGQRPPEIEFTEDDADSEPPRATEPLSELDQQIVDATAERCAATNRLWKRRLGLAQSMGQGLTWPQFRERCALEGITPGETADQLLALIRVAKEKHHV